MSKLILCDILISAIMIYENICMPKIVYYNMHISAIAVKTINMCMLKIKHCEIHMCMPKMVYLYMHTNAISIKKTCMLKIIHCDIHMMVYFNMHMITSTFGKHDMHAKNC